MATVHRSAETGEFVTAAFAAENPGSTVAETVEEFDADLIQTALQAREVADRLATLAGL